MRNFLNPFFNSEIFLLLLQGTLKTLPFSMMIALLLSLILLYNNVSHDLIILWLLAMAAISLLRFAHCTFVIKYSRYEIIDKTPLIIFLTLTFLMGLIWGSAYFLFAPSLIQIQDFVIILVLGGMAAGSIASLSPFPPAFAVYILPILIPIIFYYFFQFDFDSIILSVMILLFTIMLFAIARLNSRLLVNNLKLTNEKDSLIAALKNSNDKLGEYVREIEILSVTDALTGLYNRRFFDETLRKEVDRARRNKYPLNLVMFDIDNFKLINDKFGHPEGDRFLQSFAMSLKRFFKRANDAVFRIGGDEFTAILSNMTYEDAVAFCRVFKDEFNRDSEYDDISLSIGLVSIDASYEHSFMALITEVDKALYKAKAEGKNKIISKHLK